MADNGNHVGVRGCARSVRVGADHVPSYHGSHPALSDDRLHIVALFTFIVSLVPEAFSGLSLEDSPALASNMIYFSFVTLTTRGYGDIFPVHPIARSLCNLESIFGQL